MLLRRTSGANRWWLELAFITAGTAVNIPGSTNVIKVDLV